MKKQIQEFVRACDVCQRHKTETLHPTGLLQPLPIPNQIWTDISLDFVEGFRTSYGKNVILVVVDRFSKYCHLIPTAHPYYVVSIARLFFDNVFKLHGSLSQALFGGNYSVQVALSYAFVPPTISN